MRKYPLTQPSKWVPPVPRWQLKLPEEVTEIFTTYIGIQQHASNSSIDIARDHAIDQIENWLKELSHKPVVIDTFTVREGFDIPSSRVWVAYWKDKSPYQTALSQLNLRRIFQSLPSPTRASIGVWFETFQTPISRLETNYAGIHHHPGLGSIPETERTEHTLTAYWGAARDRIPASAYDLYTPPVDGSLRPPATVPKGLGQRLTGTNYDNIVHIRSGQIWSACPGEEAAAYETTLEPVLMEGLRYLWSNPVDTGTVGLRFLRNLDPEKGNAPIKETCGAGFFRNLEDLEKWAKRHKSHLAIFNGSHRHAREWGDDRKFMTWHEVSVLKKGEATWEYVNCSPETGVIRWVEMKEVEELEEVSGYVNGDGCVDVNGSS